MDEVCELDLCLLRDLECVVDLHPQIPDGAFQLRVTHKQLDGANVPGALVDSAVLTKGQVASITLAREKVARGRFCPSRRPLLQGERCLRMVSSFRD
jgi:hypothetical protein